MTFYPKPINRPLALEGRFEKINNRLYGHEGLIIIIMDDYVQYNHDSSSRLVDIRLALHI